MYFGDFPPHIRRFREIYEMLDHTSGKTFHMYDDKMRILASVILLEFEKRHNILPEYKDETCHRTQEEES